MRQEYLYTLKKNCHSSKLHQKFHTLWMMCLLEQFPIKCIFFFIFEWGFNGNWERGKRQNHIVIKSKAIDLFRLYFPHCCCLVGRFICSSSFIYQKLQQKILNSTREHGWFNTELFFIRNSYICITSSVVRIIFRQDENFFNSSDVTAGEEQLII